MGIGGGKASKGGHVSQHPLLKLKSDLPGRFYILILSLKKKKKVFKKHSSAKTLIFPKDSSKFTIFPFQTVQGRLPAVGLLLPGMPAGQLSSRFLNQCFCLFSLGSFGYRVTCETHRQADDFK